MPESEDVTQLEPGGAPGGARAKYVVWYGAMAFIGEFDSREADLTRGTGVVLRTPRGTELGEVLCSRTDRIDDEFKNAGHILRVATESDIHRQKYIDDNLVPTEAVYCRSRIDQRELPMKIVGVDHLFGGDKIIFYFLAEGRVDFRELVRDLAKRFETRIELTQIGVRDEARLLGDYNYCGRPLCCRSFMKRLETVTMKMAKNQKATLDPSKISGRCGRLMCCLRFENDVYSHLKKSLPRKGTYVRAGDLVGKVVNLDVLRQTVTVAAQGTGNLTFAASEVVSVPKPPRQHKESTDEPGKNPGRRGNDNAPNRTAGPRPKSQAPGKRNEPAAGREAPRRAAADDCPTPRPSRKRRGRGRRRGSSGREGTVSGTEGATGTADKSKQSPPEESPKEPPSNRPSPASKRQAPEPPAEPRDADASPEWMKEARDLREKPHRHRRTSKRRRDRPDAR